MKKHKNIIKVSNKVKPLPFDKRIISELIIGGNYFVCFGDNIVRPCKLLEIRKEDNMIVIDRTPPLIFGVPLFGKGAKLIINKNVLFYDEIGSTPIQAVHNTVG